MKRQGIDDGVYLNDGLNSYSYLGTMGGVINADIILSNLLTSSAMEYRFLDPFTVRHMVRNSGPHDFKNNRSTIYGISNKTSTLFSFEGFLMKSEDIGNFHYGVATASNIFISKRFALMMAG